MSDTDNAAYAVRPLAREDIPHIVNYWGSASTEFLDGMGADPSRMPSRAQWQANLEQILVTAELEASTFYLIWLVHGRPIGFNSLKNIVYGEQGEMHLHMWETASRGQGHGGRLFCLAVIDFFDRFKLKRIYCEPSASNLAPNRLLQRIGFPLVKTHTAASSEISKVCELNRYAIEMKVAEAFLSRQSL